VDTLNGAPRATRTLYGFNGQIVAERNSADGSLSYLHGDHLGSVAAATTASGGWPAARRSTPGARCAAAA
jgi:hypothetical protein